MNRRDILGVLATVLAMPASGLAQKPKSFTIGVLVPSLNQAEIALRIYRKGLHDLGYIEGQNLQLEIRSAEGDFNRLSGLATELVRKKVDMIATLFVPSALAAKNATRTIPIVMLAVADPVTSGIVTSLSHPGGNITGMAALSENVEKAVELLKALVPNLRRIAALVNAADPFSQQLLARTKAVGTAQGIEIEAFPVRTGPEIDAAFSAMVDKSVGAVIVQPTLPVRHVANLAIKYRLPTGSLAGFFTANGGLIAYSMQPEEVYRRSAVLTDKILKGAKPADLPIEQPTMFQFSINLKTAKAIGLTIPPALLARADEVIE